MLQALFVIIGFKRRQLFWFEIKYCVCERRR